MAVAKKPKSNAKEQLQQAIDLYRTGDYAAAERLCRKLIKQEGRDGHAWHLLGAVLRDAKRPEEAEACFHKALESDPANADAYANLGLCCADQGRLDQCIEWQRQALAIMPHHNAALLNLGTFLFQANRFAEARQAFERAEKNGRSGAVVRGLAACSKKLGQSMEAVGMYRHWLAEHPGDIDIITELGLTLLELYRWNEAKEALELGRALAPASVPILANLGTVYRTMFKYAAALEVWEAARALEPDKPEVLVNLGSLYRDLGRTREAEDTLRRAIELRPDYANAHNNLGNVFRDEGRTQEAREAFLKCIEFDQQHWCAWSNLLFTSQNIGGLPAELLAKDARRFGEALRTAGIAGGKRHANDASPERRLRIGYLSPDFLTHSVSYFIEPILKHHDRRQVHVTCFANQSAIDPMTQRLQKLADDWHFVEDLTDDQLAALIEAQRIDILVDLAGHTAKNRLPMMARQAAPVQATWIGYPDTTGLAEMNYRLTDAWADPVGETDARHTEKLIRLPQGFLCYRPLPDAPELTDPPCLAGGAVTFGSFNSLSKVDPALVALWSRILKAVPGSRLMLKSLALDAAGCREFYLQAFAEQGIERSRLTLIGKIPTMHEHLAKYSEVDIALDTYPYHGTTTTCEALWMGVPVVTLAGLRHVSRVGVSLLSQVGAGELIARDEAHYLALAVELAGDPQRLRTYRHSLRGMMASSPLCDAAGKTAAVEAAFRQLWRDWCAAASQSAKVPAAPPVAVGGSRPTADAAAGELFLRSMDKGRISFESGNWPEAAAAFREAAMLEPAAADAWANQGAALKSMGKVDEALACYRKSLELRPDSAMVYSNMGAALLNKGDIDAAEEACRKSLRIDPGYAKGYVNLALVHASKRNDSEALTAYERALELGLESAETYCNMGASLFELGRLEEAVACCEKALLLKPSFTDARANLSTALIGQGRLAEGLAEVRTVLEQRPGFALANSNLLMTMQYDDTVTSAELYNAHREWGLRFGGKGGGFDFRGREEADRRLRLGFVSTDFNAHPVGFFLEPLLSRLDRRAVEIFLYAANAHTDPVTDRIRVLADHWRLVVGLDAEAAARLVYEDRIDILFDLNGHTRGNRLDMFALRPAPLQVTWLGYPDTTGLPEMDIRLSDRHADPEGRTEQYCTERLVRLPQSFLCYQMMPGAPAVSPAPCLAGGGVTFGSFNNLSKISPTTIRLWSRLLLATAGTRLLVKARALTDEGAGSRLRAAFAREGLGEERIELRGWTPGPLGHLDQYRDVDIALDTFPYNGTTTTCEALSMGVPVVTLAGVRHAARVGVSILNGAGLAEMVAADENEYIDIAVRLAQNRERLARLREGMRERLKASPLCDATSFARDFEEACRQMWREWCAASSGDKQLTSQKDYAMQSVPQQKILKLPIPGGIRVCVPDNLSLMTPYVLTEQQDWFEAEIHFVRRLVEPGMAAIDIGANYGVYTLTIAKAVGSHGRVWAFEPARATADYLTESLAENGFDQVELVRAALSDHIGEAHLSTNANAELNTLHGSADGAGETVRLTKLDEFLEQFSRHEVAFVKLDAEGEEPNVIRGGDRFFADQSPLVMFEIKDAKTVNLNLVELFDKRGYASYRLVPGLNILVPFDARENIDPFQLNLFACKADRARLLAERGLLAAPERGEELPVPDDDLWHQWLSDKPWASGMLPKWERRRTDDGSDAGRRHRDALNLYVLSKDRALPAAGRVAALKGSYELLAPFVAEAPHLPRLCSLARVAAEFGQRGAAVSALNQLRELLQKGGSFDLDEPFLPADPRFDLLAPAGRLADWVICSVIETLDKLSRYSSYFGPDQSGLLLDTIARRAFIGEAALRRLELVKRVSYKTPIQKEKRTIHRHAKADSDDYLGRFREIISDPLNLLIRRTPNAGFVEGNHVYLHNGLRVPMTGSDAYYGKFSSILVTNRGVHEPLEEFVFQELIESLPTAPLMLELGAYWGHYSMWLKTARPDAVVRLVEPELDNLRTGMQNFERNGLTGEFIQAFVGKGQFEIDSYLKKQGILKIDILHSDIQGYEMEMLESCSDSLAGRRINYLFISTHSQGLHHGAIGLLEKSGYRIEISSDYDDDTTSFDGLVFASSPSVKPIFKDFKPLKRIQIAGARPELLIDYLSKTIRCASSHGASEPVFKDGAIGPNIIAEKHSSSSAEKSDPRTSGSPHMKILLVVPRQSKMQSYHLPVGIGYVSASLKRAGHDVTILNPNHSVEEIPFLLEQAIKDNTPQVVATGGMAFHLAQIRLVAATARALLPHAVILIGGPVVSNLPEAAMTAVPEANFGVIGEGEHTSVQLMSALETGSDLDNVKGLIYRVAETGALKRTAPRPVEENLDTLPWVDFEGLGLDIYAGLHRLGECAPALIADSGTRVMPLITSRGCPFPCTFCCHDGASRRYRVRTLDDVFAEITAAIERYHINALLLYEDLFCLKRERLEEFCKRIKPLGLRWECSLRVEQIDANILKLMKESGCCCIGLGVESMSPAILKSMQKKTTREGIEQALALIYDAKIAVWANLIFGDPAETLATVRESLEWYCNNSRYNLRFAMIGYHPGSRIYDDAVKRGLIRDPIEYLLSGNSDINATSMSDDDFQKMRILMNRSVVSFGHAGRLVDLKQTDSSSFAARCICPYCGAEGLCSTIEGKTGFRVIPSINCPVCNRAYRVPVVIRLKPSPETTPLLEALRNMEQSRDSAVAIRDICNRILSLDATNNEAYNALIALADAVGDGPQAVDLLENAIAMDPYNPILFAQMADRLAKMGENGLREKYIRKAEHLHSVGITGTSYIYIAP